MPESVDFFGESFTAPERINVRRLLRFSTMASRGVDTDDAAGMAALDGLIDQCLRPEDVDRFDALCDEKRPDAAELLEFVGKMMAVITGRPTERPSSSSDGPQRIEPNSTVDSSSRVIDRLQGRADLQLMVMQAQEARAAS